MIDRIAVAIVYAVRVFAICMYGVWLGIKITAAGCAIYGILIWPWLYLFLWHHNWTELINGTNGIIIFLVPGFALQGLFLILVIGSVLSEMYHRGCEVLDRKEIAAK